MSLNFLLVFLAALLPADLDRDGIDDDVEQALLVQFAPTFMISGDECDTLPAEFAPGSVVPCVVSKNGAIYGQVFPNGRFTEIHYYHLWSRDCGRFSHKFDVEHVSFLLAEDHKALYWYAAAH